jgi:hypothetical protein
MRARDGDWKPTEAERKALEAEHGEEAVVEELRKAEDWLELNPSYRPKAHLMLDFINRWVRRSKSLEEERRRIPAQPKSQFVSGTPDLSRGVGDDFCRAGGFWPDGSWNPGGSGRDALTRWIWRAAATRRARLMSPKELVGRMYQAGVQAGFSAAQIEAWSLSDQAWGWYVTQSSSSASQAIRNAGYSDLSLELKVLKDRDWGSQRLTLAGESERA